MRSSRSPTTIEQMGHDFGSAASGLYDVLTQLKQATEHVRHAFHNHPDQAGAAVASFAQLHGTIEQVEQLASALAVTLIDVGRSYDTNDGTVGNGWQHEGASAIQANGR